MKPIHLILPVLFLAAAPLANGCTETPDDLPECVGPGSYCPTDAGADAIDAPADAAPGATDGSNLDSALDALPSDGGATAADAATVSLDASAGD